MRDVKIIARMFGGLGNQLFIYAAARRLAQVNNAELVLDAVSGFTFDAVYRRHYQLDHFNISCRKATSEERLEPFSRLRRKILQRWNQHKPFDQRAYLVQQSIDFDPRLLQFKPEGTVYLEGYWQSERYFKDVEAIIRQDLQIIPPTDEANLNMADCIRKCTSVALHVRFFDKSQSEDMDNSLGNYYIRALDAMERMAPTAHYFVFSDQPEVARSQIPLPDARITLVSHNQGDENAYADMWLMTQCQHFIIANSTFSWWAAWLREQYHAGTNVIAPKNYIDPKNNITAWGFPGLLPDRWDLL